MNKTADALRNLADKIEKTAGQKKLTKHIDKPAPETIVYNALKNIGVPFHVAVDLYGKHQPEYIARKIFLYEFKCQTAKAKPVNPIAYILTAIRDDYNESDDFLEWLKIKRENVFLGGVKYHIDFKRLLELTY